MINGHYRDGWWVESIAGRLCLLIKMIMRFNELAILRMSCGRQGALEILRLDAQRQQRLTQRVVKHQNGDHVRGLHQTWSATSNLCELNFNNSSESLGSWCMKNLIIAIFWNFKCCWGDGRTIERGQEDATDAIVVMRASDRVVLTPWIENLKRHSFGVGQLFHVTQHRFHHIPHSVCYTTIQFNIFVNIFVGIILQTWVS